MGFMTMVAIQMKFWKMLKRCLRMCARGNNTLYNIAPMVHPCTTSGCMQEVP